MLTAGAGLWVNYITADYLYLATCNYVYLYIYQNILECSTCSCLWFKLLLTVIGMCSFSTVMASKILTRFMLA